MLQCTPPSIKKKKDLAEEKKKKKKVLVGIPWMVSTILSLSQL
jgi:hypothetical protein